MPLPLLPLPPTLLLLLLLLFLPRPLTPLLAAVEVLVRPTAFIAVVSVAGVVSPREAPRLLSFKEVLTLRAGAAKPPVSLKTP